MSSLLSAPFPSAGDERVVEVRDLGLIPYPDAVRLQDELVERRLRGGAPNTLLLLEHPPVVTLGRRASLASVYVSEQALALQGIDLQRTTRGGLATYHGPGQVVGYPIVHLRTLGFRLPEYVQGLEQVVIQSLAEFGVMGTRHPEHIGVWANGAKIAAVGVALRHGVTLHGFAVNLHPDLSHFDLFDPCGLGTLGVTSAAAMGRRVDVAAFKQVLARLFAAHFGLQPLWTETSPTGATSLQSP